MKLKLNIVYKLIAYLIIVSLLPLMIFAFISYGVVRDTIFDLTTQNSLTVIDTQRDYLQQQVVQQIENLIGRINSSEPINSILSRNIDPRIAPRSTFEELSSQEQIRISLSLFSNLKGIVSIDIITPGGERYYVGDTLSISPVNPSKRDAMIAEALEDPNPVHWLGVVDNLNTASPTRKVLSAVKIFRPFVASRQQLTTTGMLIVNYSTEVLADHFDQIDLGHQSAVYILDQNGRTIYAPDRDQIGSPAPAALRSHLRTGKSMELVRLAGRDSMISTARLERQRWEVVGVIPKETLLAPMHHLAQVLTILIVLSFIVIFLASQFFRRTMVVPIQAISGGFQWMYDKKIKVVEHLPVPKTQDEISELVVWFNTFLDTHAMRLQYEQDLIESQFKFSTIFKQAPMPLSLVNIDTGEILDVNDFWLDQFGFERDTVIGHSSLEINMWIDPVERQHILEEIQNRQTVNRLEARQRTRDGRILICQISARPLRLGQGALFIFVPVDITRLRKAEIEIQEINQQLESRVLARTWELQKINHELHQALETLNTAQAELVRTEKLAALGSLVAGVAHEINTPVGIIITSGSVLQDATQSIADSLQTGPIRRSQLNDYIQLALDSSRLIMANAQRAGHLIQSFKQVAVDQTSEQRRQFDLAVFLNDLITSLHPSLKKSKISIKLISLDPDIQMDSYPGLLAQVLTNLTMNSLTHAFADRSAGCIVVQLALDGDMVAIDFSDDGCGIPPAILDKVFDPFFTTRRGHGGTGLGLNIVFNIVNKQFGGSIVVHNRKEGGVLFRMRLPRVVRELSIEDNSV